MSEFTAGFSDTYQTDLRSMLDTSQELAAFLMPAAFVEGNPFVDNGADIGIIVDGVDGNRYEYGTLEMEAVLLEKQAALTEMIVLSSAAMMDISTSEIVMLPFADDNNRTPEQETQVDVVIKRVEDRVKNATSTYAKYLFGDTESEQYTVTTLRIADANGVVIARELEFEIEDEYLKRSLRVVDIPTSSPDYSVEVSQTLSPVQDEGLRSVIEFFLQNNDEGSIVTVMNLFKAELIGKDPSDVSELIDRYEALDKGSELLGLIEKIKAKAVATQESNKIVLANPELNSPSAEELQVYMELLDQIRS
ncbi:MAG: hypothetical protein ABI220_03855 [Candidatus Saccharimonadales bacterium]